MPIVFDDEQAAAPNKIVFDDEPMSGMGFARNMLTDAASNIKSNAELASYAFPPLAAMKAAQGENIYDPNRLKQLRTGLVKGLKEYPSRLKEELTGTKPWYKNPISSALDVAPFVQGGIEGANALRAPTRSLATKTLPGIFKSTAGIPEQATERAITKPDILRTPPVGEEELSSTVGQPVINALKSAKQRVQTSLGKAYKKYAGLNNPIDDLISGNSPPNRTFDELTIDHDLAKSGDLFKRRNLGGGISEFTDKEKLKALTLLKREIQSHTEFNKAPITLKPIDSVKDAALKKMASEVDEIRGKLPNGKRLAAIDGAYKDIHDIFDTVQNDLKEPGKARDMLMRLLRGDNTWLTSGRMKTKINAIRRAELLSGTQVLEPALDEMTRQSFKEWTGKGFSAQMLRGMGGAGALYELGAGHPLTAAGSAASLLASSPRVLRGGLKATSRVGDILKNLSLRKE